ncbi:MAG TPA: hypothetical protein PKJ26_05480, partial [Candidatus Woesebacteria bacterium]|nr:hypothetical protein [Candidatus Woesebacteria bacterium]
MRRLWIVLLVFFIMVLSSKSVAASVDSIGIHILHPQELSQVRQLFSEQNTNKHTPVYVTIP